MSEGPRNPLWNISAAAGIISGVGFVFGSSGKLAPLMGSINCGLLGALVSVTLICIITTIASRITVTCSCHLVRRIFAIVYYPSGSLCGLAVVCFIGASMLDLVEQYTLPCAVLAMTGVFCYAIECTIRGTLSGTIIGNQPLIAHCVLGGAVGTGFAGSVAMLIVESQT